MDSLLGSNNQIDQSQSMVKQAENTAVLSKSPETSQASPFLFHHIKNIYPFARHILIITFILFAFCLLIFLIHQNGKSIYDNGL